MIDMEDSGDASTVKKINKKILGEFIELSV